MIAVIGEFVKDVDEFYDVFGHKDGYPILSLVNREQRPGGAGAVLQMIERLGEPGILVTDTENANTSQRIIVGNSVICSLKGNAAGSLPDFLPYADLVLVVDDGKGVVTQESWKRIVCTYGNREIIVDAHPSRPAGFYCGATAIMSPVPVVANDVPLIQTKSHDGLTLTIGGVAYDLPSLVCGQALDPCGAGDSVLATLGVARLRNAAWLDACRIAMENAAIVCSRWGAYL